MANKAYTLENGEERAQENPNTFEIPPRSERETLLPGDMAKVVLVVDGMADRMWVEVTTTDPNAGLPYEGPLRNHVPDEPALARGSIIEFGPEHIIDIIRGEAGREV